MGLSAVSASDRRNGCRRVRGEYRKVAFRVLPHDAGLPVLS